MKLARILEEAIKVNASDIHLRGGLPPVFRINGSLERMSKLATLDASQVRDISHDMMTDWQLIRFEESKQIDLSYEERSCGRYRVNIYQQMGEMTIAMRYISSEIPKLDELHLPPVAKKIALEPRGLVLVTGTTGCGKSTTLASMIQIINREKTCHVLTIEDPIEYLHPDHTSVVSQREIGVDTDSFAGALRAALRQDPDVILIGEMRDFETIEAALIAAETGHLVLSTIHTTDVTESIMRIISVFPPHTHIQVRKRLASVLRGVISQRLLPRVDGLGRIPAVEVMVSTSRIRECIEDPEKTREIYGAVAVGRSSYGMQTFDQALIQLLETGLISYETALENSNNPDDFALRAKGITFTSDSKWGEAEDEQEKKEDEDDEEEIKTMNVERFGNDQ